MHMAKLIFGIDVTFKPFGFDASNAFRSGLLAEPPMPLLQDGEDTAMPPPLNHEDGDEDDDEDDAPRDASGQFAHDALAGDEYFTDYAHAMRKLTQEEGPPRLHDRIENLPFVCEAVAQLHLCTSAEQFAQLAEIVLDELRARKEDRFADYVIRTGSGYFVKPWNRWFIGAPRITLKDGGRSGSDISYQNVGPYTNPGERYNLILQETVLLNKRSSKEHLLGKALPEQMILDATDRAGTVPMCLAVTSLPTETLSRAVSILEDGKRKVFAGTGPTPTGSKFPCGSKLYVNKVGARLLDVTAKRVADCESSHQGRGYRKESTSSLASFVDKHMSLSCVEKLADGTWICRCHDWQYFGHCPDAAVALELDGKIDCKALLREVPANNRGGRPTKSVSGRQKQPAAVDSRDSILPSSSGLASSSNGASSSSSSGAFTSRAGAGAKRARAARGTHQPTGKQFLGNKVAKKFKSGFVLHPCWHL